MSQWRKINSVRSDVVHACLCQDLQQFVVGEEVEAGEGHALSLQIVLQALADGFQHLIALLECFKQP